MEEARAKRMTNGHSFRRVSFFFRSPGPLSPLSKKKSNRPSSPPASAFSPTPTTSSSSASPSRPSASSTSRNTAASSPPTWIWPSRASPSSGCSLVKLCLGEVFFSFFLFIIACPRNGHAKPRHRGPWSRSPARKPSSFGPKAAAAGGPRPRKCRARTRAPPERPSLPPSLLCAGARRRNEVRCAASLSLFLCSSAPPPLSLI